jgi:hypothetical protein
MALFFCPVKPKRWTIEGSGQNEFIGQVARLFQQGCS